MRPETRKSSPGEPSLHAILTMTRKTSPSGGLQAVIAIDFFNVLPLFELDLPLMVVV